MSLNIQHLSYRKPGLEAEALNFMHIDLIPSDKWIPRYPRPDINDPGYETAPHEWGLTVVPHRHAAILRPKNGFNPVYGVRQGKLRLRQTKFARSPDHLCPGGSLGRNAGCDEKREVYKDQGFSRFF